MTSTFAPAIAVLLCAHAGPVVTTEPWVLEQSTGVTSAGHPTEYVESAGFLDESQARTMRDYQRDKYGERKIQGGVTLTYLTALPRDQLIAAVKNPRGQSLVLDSPRSQEDTGSVIPFRKPTAWDQYKPYIIGAGIVLLVQTALIAGLLIQLRKRRRTEVLLEESRRRYELAAKAAHVGVWDWNLRTGHIYLDPALKRALGFADHEIEDHIQSWGRRVHPEDVALVRADAQAHVDGRTPIYEVEHRMLHKDGSIRWFLARGSAVRLPDGRAMRLVGTNTDITERKKTERRLQEAQEELARVSRFTALGQFAASIAHEISQPLGAILLNSRACMRWLGIASPPMDEIRNALQEIADSGNRAKELMRRNRELFEHHTVEKRSLDINSVVREVAALARSRLQHSQITLETTLDQGVPPVVGDRVELQQVLLNLLVNGMDAMEAVDATWRQIHIDSRLTDEGVVQITVRDNGLGLGNVDVDRIFMPAYTTKPNGTGVGLSICRAIVEAHGGTLWAEPNVDRGAAFSFTIPVSTAAVTDIDGTHRAAGSLGP